MNRVPSPADDRAENHKSEYEAQTPEMFHLGYLLNGYAEDVVGATVAEDQHLTVTNDLLNTDF